MKENKFDILKEESEDFAGSSISKIKHYKLKILKDKKELPYKVIGTNKEEAHALLTENLRSLYNFLVPAVKEYLYKVDFKVYLVNKDIISDFSKFSSSSFNVEEWAKDLRVVQAFIDFNVKDCKVDHGWPDILILKAICFQKNTELVIWNLKGSDKSEEIVINELYSKKVIEFPSKRVDLLISASNHFNVIDFHDGIPLPDDRCKLYVDTSDENGVCCCLFMFKRKKSTVKDSPVLKDRSLSNK